MTRRTYVKRAIASVVLPIALLIPLQTVDAGSKQFSDVNEGTIYYEPIHALADKEIVQGYTDGEFKYRSEITRAEAALMITRLLNLDTENAPPAPFTDVKQGEWYSGAVNALYDAGIIVGNGDGLFGTNEDITRAELSKIIVEGYNLEMQEVNALPFEDVNNQAWYTDYLRVLYSHGLISGTSATTFEPNEPMIRGDFALLSYNTEYGYGDLFLELEEAVAISAYQISATFNNEETAVIHLDQPLEQGENTRTFTYKGETYEDRLDYELIYPKDIALENEYVAAALPYLGIPYLFGGETTEGFDCSAFTRRVYEEAKGLFLPRSTDRQWDVGQDVALEDIQVGDVVFFSNTYREGISHNGIYVGNGKIIHSSRTYGISIASLSSSYWQKKFTGVKRFENLRIPEEDPVVSEATKYIGESPYQAGGATPEGFGAAEFVQYVFMEAEGIELPADGYAQMEIGDDVAREDLQPGDIVFLEANYMNPTIYVGNGQIVHVTVSKGVTVTNLVTSSFWGPKYVGAKRVTKENYDDVPEPEEPEDPENPPEDPEDPPEYPEDPVN
ncbi:MAG: NlpC/P60 family protein [Halobacillus sp.]|uniref:NlpC/P60 family protein n=3 Tax=Halobacillus sp. TaxID=56800 RepID=UPI003BB1DDCB